LEYEVLEEVIDDIYEILSLEDSYILKTNLQKIIQLEFGRQVNSIYNQDDGKIKLIVKDRIMEAIFNSQNIKEIKNDKIIINTKAIYIDDPFVVDGVAGSFVRRGITNHKGDLKKLLVSKPKKNDNIVENAIIEKKLERINEKLNSIFREGTEFNFYDRKVRLNNSVEELDIRNLSTGLKTFVILKNLISNGVLESRGTIILDEPEIHLHPEWQLLFAEIIVLLQKELDLHILLATHSPYFLRAIQVYAGNYGIADRCKYYLARNEENSSVIDDVSDNIELIFEKLARPLQKLEDLLYEKV
jgi:predicted ATPase